MEVGIEFHVAGELSLHRLLWK